MKGREVGWEASGSWSKQVKGRKEEKKGGFIEKEKTASARALARCSGACL